MSKGNSKKGRIRLFKVWHAMGPLLFPGEYQGRISAWDRWISSEDEKSRKIGGTHKPQRVDKRSEQAIRETNLRLEFRRYQHDTITAWLKDHDVLIVIGEDKHHWVNRKEVLAKVREKFPSFRLSSKRTDPYDLAEDELPPVRGRPPEYDWDRALLVLFKYLTATGRLDKNGRPRRQVEFHGTIFAWSAHNYGEEAGLTSTKEVCGRALRAWDAEYPNDRSYGAEEPSGRIAIGR